MKKNLLAGLIATLLVSGAFAFEPFTVTDIRVDGIQRTEAGTVFSYLPVKVGDTMTDDKAAQAVKALFATGFFKDVRLEIEGGVLVVLVDERPAIASIEFVGLKAFEKDQIKKGLTEVGLAESRILTPVVRLRDGTYVPKYPSHPQLRGRANLGHVRNQPHVVIQQVPVVLILRAEAKPSDRQVRRLDAHRSHLSV